MWDFVMDKSGAGAGFLREFLFPLPIFIPPISPQPPSRIIRGWYNRPVVAAVPKVPPCKLKKKNEHRKILGLIPARRVQFSLKMAERNCNVLISPIFKL
jgi:hypothetical protein